MKFQVALALALCCSWSCLSGGGKANPVAYYGSWEKLSVGPPEDFVVGEVDQRLKGSNVWVVRERSGLYALSSICTRLGWSVDWVESEQRFVCSNCGSKFLRTGANESGPAPRSLDRHRIVLGGDGQISVDRCAKYRHEQVQWDMDGAFLVYPRIAVPNQAQSISVAAGADAICNDLQSRLLAPLSRTGGLFTRGRAMPGVFHELKSPKIADVGVGWGRWLPDAPCRWSRIELL